MHELSIAINIVEIAEAETRKAGASRVTDLDLEVGAFSGVVIEALEFAMKEAVRNSVLETAKVTIHEISARGRCSDCGKEFGVTDYFDICPACNGTSIEITQGQELQVKSLNVV